MCPLSCPQEHLSHQQQYWKYERNSKSFLVHEPNIGSISRKPKTENYLPPSHIPQVVSGVIFYNFLMEGFICSEITTNNNAILNFLYASFSQTHFKLEGSFVLCQELTFWHTHIISSRLFSQRSTFYVPILWLIVTLVLDSSE